jgi:hypothetical protein
VRRRWACPPEWGAAATPNSTLLHAETLCPELVLEDCSYFYDTSDDLVRLLKSLFAESSDPGHLYRGSWFSFEEGLRRFRRGLEAS